MGVSHKKLADWYHRVGQLLEAGVGLAEAIETAEGAPPGDLRRMSAQLAAGTAIDTVLMNGPGWLPEADRLMLSAGAETGRLPEAMETLSREHQFMAQVSGSATAASIYPLVILHLAVLAYPATGFFKIGPDLEAPDISFATYAQGAGEGLIFLWGCLGLCWLVARTRPSVLRGVLRRVPGIGGFLKYHELGRFCAAFGGFLKVGIDYERSLGGAAVLCRERPLREAALDLLKRTASGAAPLEVMRADRRFPPDFVQIYAGGEVTGKVPENLEKLAGHYRDRAGLSLNLAAFWYPKLLFGAVAALIAWQVIRAYSGYLEEILKLL